MSALSESTPTLQLLISSILLTIEKSIIPLTRSGVSTGSKVFGAAILSRQDLHPYTVATNDERNSPLMHGEIACIQRFFTIDFPENSSRPSPRKDCIFLATHEPCSLCLSAIAWTGFKEVHFLFTYEESRDLFDIPYDIQILEEVFRVQGSETVEQVKKRPLYNRVNRFFTATCVADMIEDVKDENEKLRLREDLRKVKMLYHDLSEVYQRGKADSVQTASTWK